MARVARRKTTIYDIAAADPSASTVGLVLGGILDPLPHRRGHGPARHRGGEEAGLQPENPAARGLRLSRSGLAGMILPHDRIRFFAGAFEAEARRRDLCPIVVSTQRDAAVEAGPRRPKLS